MINLYKDFFETYYKDMEDYFLNYFEGDITLTKENYLEKVLQQTELTIENFEPIERRINQKIPDAFKNFFVTCYSFERYFQVPTMTLAAAWIKNPFDELENLLFRQEYSDQMLSAGLIPVGIYYDNYYVCLDTRNIKTYEDAPITTFDLVSAMSDENPICDDYLFSSFDKLIECMTDYMITGDILNFKTIDEGSNFP